MDIVNRMMNVTYDGPPPGVLTIPRREPYFAKVLHCTFRNVNLPHRSARNTHVHDVYHIILVTGGRGTFVIGKTLQAVEAGQVYFTSPGEWHSFGNAEGEDAEYCEVTFEFHGRAGRRLTLPFDAVLSAWTGKPCRRVSHVAAGAELHGLIMGEIEKMVRLGLAQQPDYELYLNESLSRLLLTLYSQVFRERPSAQRDDPLQRVQEHIHKHFAEPLSLDELAGLAGFTPNYLSRRFKVRYGATPITYQHRLRIQAASNLLLTTEHAIKKIADLVGFSDIYFFSRMFKKYKGSPPGRFRRAGEQL